MSSAKLAVVCGLVAVAVSGCGSSAKPEAGSSVTLSKPSARGRIDDPRLAHLKCLEQHHIPAVLVAKTDIQVGSPQSGPLVVFTPTPGSAQYAQISAQEKGAEVIGAALLYPRSAPDGELKTIEACVAQGVTG
jgi:hypothetical protein